MNKQVNKFYNAVKALDRLYGGNGDDSFSGLQFHMNQTGFSEVVYDHVLATGDTSYAKRFADKYSADIQAKYNLHALCEEAANKAMAARAAKAAREAAEQAQAQRDFEAAKSDAVYYASAEFREEVIAEIIATGATRLQAEGRTRDQARLYNEARELGLM